MEKKYQAQELFKNGFNCSQSVFSVFGPDFGLTKDTSLKLACPFGGGMGRNQYTCGAVTGALMALGLQFGKGSNDTEEQKKLTYDITNEFFAEFKKKFGSINCIDLLDGLELVNPEDHEKIVARDLFATRCAHYVGFSVELTEQILSTRKKA